MNTYTVQPGDTLTKIGQDYGVSVSALVNANAISNPDLISIGDTLIIPGSGAQQLTPVVITAQRAAVPIPGTGGPVFDVQAWLKPPRLYYTLAALAFGAFLFSGPATSGRRKRR